MPSRRITQKVIGRVTVTQRIRIRQTVSPIHTSRPTLSSTSMPALTSRTVRRTPLTSFPSLVRNEETELHPDIETGQIYDVFISHASEDKDSFVRSLANALEAEGLSVWYDEFTLRIGDSLRRSIDRGIMSSKMGVVVFSKHFFAKDAKGWMNYELDGIITKNVSGQQQLLPIWHGISSDEMMRYSPSLADKVARNTSDYTAEQIAAEIAELIRAV